MEISISFQVPPSLNPPPPPPPPSQFFDQDGDGIVTLLDLSSKLPISKLTQQPNKGQNGRNSAAPTKMDYGTWRTVLCVCLCAINDFM